MKRQLTKIMNWAFRNGTYNALNELQKTQWLKPDELKQIQENRFIQLINNCRKYVPYYRNLPSVNDIRNLQDIHHLPFLTKKIITDNKNSFKADNVNDSQLIAMYTSGSSGEKLNFYSDRKNYHSWACTIRGDMWAGYSSGDRQVYLWEVHQSIPLKIRIRYGLRNILMDHSTILPEHKISAIDLERHLQIFNGIKPQFFAGYPTSLAVFASFIERNNLKVHSPNGIISTAEMLFENERELIESVFRCKVLNRYGSTEVFHIAGECTEQNGLHISSEHIYLEVIDTQGNPCKIGEPGEIVITDLTNHSFPFIRYKIGDMGVLSDRKCHCGRGLPLLESLDGRVDDTITGPNGIRVNSSFWKDLLHDQIAGIERFQVMQDKLDHVFIKLVINSDFNDSSIKIIETFTKNKFSNQMKVDISKVDDIPLSSAGKLHYIISDISLYS